MSRKTIIIFIVFFASLTAGAQAGLYTLASVPEALRAKATVVTHLEDITYEVESLDKTRYRVHKIYTVVNEEGKDALFFAESSSKDVSLEDAEIRVYDGNGKQTAKYRKKDMTTVATGEGLIMDGYLTYYRITPPSYPVTIEVNYEQKFRSTLVIPDYRFIHPKESILSSTYTARVPAEMGFKYKPVNTTLQPVVTQDGRYKVYKWAVKDLAPIENEDGAVSAESRYPHVALVNEQFSHYGFRGDLSSWKSFGEWISSLYTGLDELPSDRQQFFANLVKDIPDRKEKIRKIYQYMQGNFRYVSIQLGIGGLQPFSAAFTDQKKYGDCKALSNYMRAALKTIGIRSHVAIINAGFNQEPVDAGFPTSNFNHVILCVPDQKDSIWLECTSNTAGFGELGTFTENRNALLITENGGVLVATPKSEASANQFSTRTTVSLSDDLSGTSETVIRTSGEYREILDEIIKQKKDEQKRDIVFYWGFKQPDDFVLARENESARLKMTFSKIHEFNSGDKVFINPRMNKLWSSRLPKAENRKLDFYFRHPFEKHDTTIYKLPAGSQPDVLTKEKELKCDYASFASKAWYNEQENAIYIASALILRQHKIPALSYAAVKKFFDDVVQEDAQKLVIKKGEASRKAF